MYRFPVELRQKHTSLAKKLSSSDFKAISDIHQQILQDIDNYEKKDATAIKNIQKPMSAWLDDEKSVNFSSDDVEVQRFEDLACKIATNGKIDFSYIIKLTEELYKMLVQDIAKMGLSPDKVELKLVKNRKIIETRIQETIISNENYPILLNYVREINQSLDKVDDAILDGQMRPEQEKVTDAQIPAYVKGAFANHLDDKNCLKLSPDNEEIRARYEQLAQCYKAELEERSEPIETERRIIGDNNKSKTERDDARGRLKDIYREAQEAACKRVKENIEYEWDKIREQEKAKQQNDWAQFRDLARGKSIQLPNGGSVQLNQEGELSLSFNVTAGKHNFSSAFSEVLGSALLHPFAGAAALVREGFFAARRGFQVNKVSRQASRDIAMAMSLFDPNKPVYVFSQNKTIAKSLGAILRQNHLNVIVAGDNSTQRSFEDFEAYEEKNKSIFSKIPNPFRSSPTKREKEEQQFSIASTPKEISEESEVTEEPKVDKSLTL